MNNSAARNDRACPYCGVLFPKAPKRKVMCEACGECVYVRTKQRLFNSDLLTEEDMLAADFFKVLSELGATREAYFKVAESLRAKFGPSATSYDFVWALSNKMIAASAQTGSVPGDTLHSAKMITLAQAWYQYRRDRDPAHLLKIVRGYELQELRNTERLFPAGIFVKVRSEGCCDVCESLHRGELLELPALMADPILPVAGCTKNLEGRKYSYCTCSYLFEEKG